MSVQLPHCFALLIVSGLSLAFATELECVPSNKTALTFGTEVVIHCTYAQPDTAWNCDQGPDIYRPNASDTFSNPYFPKNSRLVAMQGTAARSCSFKIVELDDTDDGLWRIKATINRQNADAMVIWAHFTLEVFKPLSSVFLQRDGDIMATKVQEQLWSSDSKEMTVQCMVMDTFPMPHFQWYENGIESNVSSMPSQISDTSNYHSVWKGSISRENVFTNLTCLASHGNGLKSLSTTTLIEAQFNAFGFHPTKFFSMSKMEKRLIVIKYRANPIPDYQPLSVKINNGLIDLIDIKQSKMDNFSAELSFEFQMRSQWNGQPAILTIGNTSTEIIFYTVKRIFLQKNEEMIGDKTSFQLGNKASREIAIDCLAIDIHLEPIFHWYVNGQLIKTDKVPQKLEKYENSYISTWRSSEDREAAEPKNLTCQVIQKTEILNITTAMETEFNPFDFQPKKFYSMTENIAKPISITFRANPMPKLDEITWCLGQKVFNVSSPSITMNLTKTDLLHKFKITLIFQMKAEWKDKNGKLTIGESETEDITLYALSKKQMYERRKFKKVVIGVGVVVGLIICVMIYIFTIRHRGSGLISTSAKIVYWCRHRFQPID